MAIRKHGEGSVLKAEDVQKTSSTETEEDRQERLAALNEENQEHDG